MSIMTEKWTLGACVLALAGVVAFDGAPARAAGLTAVERLYADLSQLGPEERAARILEGAKKEKELRFTNSLGGALGRGYVKIFETAHPFVKSDPLFISDPIAVEQMMAETTAGRVYKDAMTGINISELSEPLKRDLLARYPTPATGRMLPQYGIFKDPESRYTPILWSEKGISYNPAMLTEGEAPKTYEDLCNPALAGQVSYEPIRAYAVYHIYMVYGGDMKKTEAWMKCMGANKPILAKGHTTRLQLMFAGDHAVQGLNFFYQGIMDNRKNPRKAPFKPVYTAPVQAAASTAIINKLTPYPYGSALLVDWTLSEAPQRYLGDAGRGPVAFAHPYMPSDVDLVPLPVPDEKILNVLFDMWRRHLGVAG